MHNGIGDGVVQNAAKAPIEGSETLALLEDASELFVARGKRVLRFDLGDPTAPGRGAARAAVGTLRQAAGSGTALPQPPDRGLQPGTAGARAGIDR